MTSASELFYQRRSRVGRAVAGSSSSSSGGGTDLGLESSVYDRSFRSNYNRHHHLLHPLQYQNQSRRHDLDGCDPLRRSRPRLSSFPDRSWGRVEQGTSGEFGPGTSRGGEGSTGSISGSGGGGPSRGRPVGGGSGERLPGAVLLARARLLERLRGVSLSANRRSARAASFGMFDRGASFGMFDREYTLSDDLRVVDAGDWGTGIPNGFSANVSPFSDSTLQLERLDFVRDSYKKKPPGLTPEALQCLRLEVYSSTQNGSQGEASQSSRDCSICLESFAEGDELVCLPCEHRFHHSCLDPWVRTCGDCPYCRRDIIVSSHRP